MPDHIFQYISFHRVRFAEPVNSNERLLNGPPLAAHWLSGPASPIGEDGLRTRISDIWCGMGFYPTRAAAEKVLECPADYLNFLADTSESVAWPAGPIQSQGADELVRDARRCATVDTFRYGSPRAARRRYIGWV